VTFQITAFALLTVCGLLALSAVSLTRHYPRAFLLFLGAVVLAVAIILWCEPNSPRLIGFATGVVLSLCLIWLGYRAPREPAAEGFLRKLLPPVPATRAVEPEEVFGPWQFYVDDAASTVTVDLQADGHYTQTIVPTYGDRITCPGGAWTLDGPYVELTGYRSAVRETMNRVCWFFGEGKQDLVLWARDDPQSDADLLGQRVLL
jgi:hypothetical protein